ncbi:MAG: AAA family ATPase [Nitrospira sp.]|nr:AAA family ATPase [Nitrospira sp.]
MTTSKQDSQTSVFSRLEPALRRLDQLLAKAVAAAQVAYSQAAAGDLYRGLYIGPEEVQRLLTREPTTSIFWGDGSGPDEISVEAINESPRFNWLRQAFGLSSFDLDVIVIVLAPELDLRYERLYAYLQDDVTRKRPSVDLVLNLLCGSVPEKLNGRRHFATDAPLIAQRLVQLIADPHQVQPPLLTQHLKLDEQVIKLFLEETHLDPRLTACCWLSEPVITLEAIPIEKAIKQATRTMVREARKASRPLRLYVQGPPGIGARQFAEALARESGAKLVTVDLSRLLDGGTDHERVLTLICREAWLQDAVLYIEELDTVRTENRPVLHRLLCEALAKHAGLVVLTGTLPWVPPGHGLDGVMAIPLPYPDWEQRRLSWEAALTKSGMTATADCLDKLSDRYRLTTEQITDAVATVRNRSMGVSKAKKESRLAEELLAAARAQSGHELARLAKKITPIPTWDDIVLPADTLTQLRELCQRVGQRRRVLGEWGFDKKLSLGKGVNALFAGSSGTGKTMAAEVIANELGLDLYKIDLSGVVSKYIGETEKNLDRIFSAVEQANAILFFDEADALFGKRSEVRDSHDRYANIEISYLLQKMEQYEGITILASNLRQNLDDAFIRRLAFTIHFPFPDEVQRQEIWEKVWPTQVPLAKDVDLEFLAQQFKLSGGNIKNIALASAFLAAADGGKVTMGHLRHATQREYQKLGKTLSSVELGGVSNGARVQV